jgi:phosphohistidine phosphatase SixA
MFSKYYHMRKLFPAPLSFVFLSLFWLASCTSASTIYVVRHAEKSAPSGDVPLSGEGLQRAEDLKERLKDKKIAAVYSTSTKRTQQTAAPTASYFNTNTVVYSNADSLMKALIAVKKKNTLVVGHSNTVPQMLRAIGLNPGFEGNIPDNKYDNLFEVTVKKGKNGGVSLKPQKYGTASN